MGLASLTLPNTVVPRNQKPHNHPLESLHMVDYTKLPGTAWGYCGAWAVEVAERFLGEDSGEPSMTEWKETTEELGVDPLDGGVTIQDLMDYYQVRDFKVSFVELKKNKCDAQYYAAKKLDNQCVVMLLMLPTQAVGVGGHVETVLGVEACEIHTNSWGSDGAVSMKGRFSHSNMTVYNTVDMEAFFMIACR